jgi:hypothetical protein
LTVQKFVGINLRSDFSFSQLATFRNLFVYFN